MKAFSWWLRKERHMNSHILENFIILQTKENDRRIASFWFFYTIFIHFGMIVWLISGIASIAMKNLCIKLNFLKLACAVIGASAVLPIIWYFLTEYNDSPGAREEGLGLLFANIPAILVTGTFYQGTNYSGVFFYIFYPLFGAIGGWGIGQFIEWVYGLLRRIER